jgi:hypothetical protein
MKNRAIIGRKVGPLSPAITCLSDGKVLENCFLFGSDPAELLNHSLLFDLVLSLHSDSLFFFEKSTLGLLWPQVRESLLSKD